MARTRTLVAATLALLAVCALPASGQGNEPLTFVLRYGDQGHHINQPVDYLTWCGDCGGVDYHSGTPWVINPSDCIWDSDDFFSYVSQGSVLAAGASASIQECRYAGFLGAPYDYLGINLTSSSPDLQVVERWRWSGGEVGAFTAPTFDPSVRLWRYHDCIQAPFAQAPLIEIPDSHGGYALPQVETVTVMNLGRKAGKTGGVISSNYSRGEIQGFGCLTFRSP